MYRETRRLVVCLFISIEAGGATCNVWVGLMLSYITLSLALMVKIANTSFTYLLLEVLMTAVVPHHNAPFVAVFDKQQPP